MRRFMLGVAVSAFVAISAVSAQAQTDPVTQHYQAYTAALEAGDRAAAERAAAAALAASEAANAEGGRTAVLAANLAELRLQMNRPADALAPAQRALRISQRAGSSSGVDPLYAELLVGQAELGSDGEAGERRILAALPRARAQGSLNPEAFEAAIALGNWALRNDRAEIGREAFEHAIALSPGDDDVNRASRALGIVGRGIALTMIEPAPSRRGSTGTRLTQAPRAESSDAFAEAVRLARPAAERDARTGRMSRAQSTYATALAWLNDRSMLLRSLDWDDRVEFADRVGFAVPLDGGSTACLTKLQVTPAPTYEVGSIRAVGGNVVVLRVVTNAAGDVTDRRIVGAVGDGEFVRAVNAVTPQWTADRADCAGARVDFVPVAVIPNDQVQANYSGASGRAASSLPLGTSARGPVMEGRTSGATSVVSGQTDGLTAVVIR